MTHSHLPVYHLIRQIEEQKEKGTKRRSLPEWMTSFIDEIADTLEPTQGVARLGFDCKLTEAGWDLSLFLGHTEIVGGKDDGHSRVPNFNLDINAIAKQFQSLKSLDWESRPYSGEISIENEYSAIIFKGVIQNENLTLSVLDRSPEEIGPGMKEHSDGQLETI